MQNKQQPAHYPSFKSKLKVSTKRGHSFKLKCTTVPQGGQGQGSTEGMANMRLSLNLESKRRSNPEAKSHARMEPLDRVIELAEVETHEKDLNDSDLLCLENLTQTLTTKKQLANLSPGDSTDE